MATASAALAMVPAPIISRVANQTIEARVDTPKALSTCNSLTMETDTLLSANCPRDDGSIMQTDQELAVCLGSLEGNLFCDVK
jgi:hypothetical protein